MDKRRRIIAVVDDDLSMLSATKDMLDALDFVAKTYASGEEFLNDRGDSEVDCLLLDIHLGGMSGVALRRQLRESGSTLPVIFMTAFDDEVTHQQALNAGCIAYLRKPCPPRALIDAIEKALAG